MADIDNLSHTGLGGLRMQCQFSIWRAVSYESSMQEPALWHRAMPPGVWSSTNLTIQVVYTS
jgi:hypothetical protein